MLKTLYTYITESFSISDNPIENYIIMAVILSLSLAIAWVSVKLLYAVDAIDGSGTGRIVHWIIRTIAFVAIFSIFTIVINVYQWIVSIPSYVWWSVIIVAGL